MEQVVTLDDFGIRIGENRESVPRFSRQLTGLFRRVNADGHRTNASRLKLIEIFLDAS
jgi:hypothetical protein